MGGGILANYCAKLVVIHVCMEHFLSGYPRELAFTPTPDNLVKKAPLIIVGNIGHCNE